MKDKKIIKLKPKSKTGIKSTKERPIVKFSGTTFLLILKLLVIL